MKLAMLSAMTCAVLLAGCGNSDNDNNSGTSARNVSGTAIDGYVTNATVWADTDNDGERDAFEAKAMTDDDGFFGYNPVTKIDYCATSDLLLRLHCLQVPSALADVVIRISGGYDELSGQPFEGALAHKISFADNPLSTKLNVISPITTVLTDLSDSEKTGVLSTLDILAADLERDYYNKSADVNATVTDVQILKDRQLAKLNLKIHKMMSALARPLKNSFKADVDSNFDLDLQSSREAYREFGKALRSENSVEAYLESEVKIKTLLANAAQALDTAIETKLEKTVQPKTVTDIASDERLEQFARITDFVETIFLELDANTAPTVANAKGINKLVEAAIDKIRSASEADVLRVLSVLKNAGDRKDLLDEVSKDNVSVSQLKDRDLADLGAVQELSNRTDTRIFTDLAGKRIQIGKQDAAEDIDMSTLVYFNGEAGANKGTLTLCARYVRGLNENSGLKAGHTLGIHGADGTWKTVNDGYGVKLTYNIRGISRSAIIQYDSKDQQDKYQYFTDVVDDFEIYAGSNVETFANAAPTDDASCRTALDMADPLVVTSLASQSSSQ